MSPAAEGPTVDPQSGAGWSDPSDLLRRQLFERRMVALTGRLDDEQANGVGVALMALDASGDEAVQLQIASDDGTIGAALALMDIVELLGVPVRATCVGAAGPALGVLAVCHHRTVSPHARLRLYEPPVEFTGRARQLEQMATMHMDQWGQFCTRLAEVTGQPVDRLRSDAATGRFLTAEEAVRYGLADEVAAPDARVYRLPDRPMGFGPR
jgi:ATP-dependent Clp protease protease subunit